MDTKWQKVQFRVQPDDEGNHGGYIKFPDGTYVHIASVWNNEPIHSLVDLFAPAVLRPDQFTDIGLLFSCGFDKSGFTVAECYKNNKERTHEVLNDFLRHAYERVLREDGTRIGEMDDLAELIHRADESRATAPLAVMLRSWQEKFGVFPVRGPRGGVVKKKGYSKKK